MTSFIGLGQVHAALIGYKLLQGVLYMGGILLQLGCQSIHKYIGDEVQSLILCTVGILPRQAQRGEQLRSGGMVIHGIKHHIFVTVFLQS